MASFEDNCISIYSTETERTIRPCAYDTVCFIDLSQLAAISRNVERHSSIKYYVQAINYSRHVLNSRSSVNHAIVIKALLMFSPRIEVIDVARIDRSPPEPRRNTFG